MVIKSWKSPGNNRERVGGGMAEWGRWGGDRMVLCLVCWWPSGWPITPRGLAPKPEHTPPPWILQCLGRGIKQAPPRLAHSRLLLLHICSHWDPVSHENCFSLVRVQNQPAMRGPRLCLALFGSISACLALSLALTALSEAGALHPEFMDQKSLNSTASMSISAGDLVAKNWTRENTKIFFSPPTGQTQENKQAWREE